MIRRSFRSFTLIELLVVVAILALLIGILVPSLRGARSQGKRVACAANLRSIGQAHRLYLDNNNQLLPVVELLPSQPWPFGDPKPRLVDTLRPYLDEEAPLAGNEKSVFRCPADVPGRTDRPLPSTGKSYFETEGSSYQVNRFLYFWMLEDSGNGPEIQQTTMYNLVRKQRVISYHGGQPAENEVPVIRDYEKFHASEGGQHPINYLYIDGHVADLER